MNTAYTYLLFTYSVSYISLLLSYRYLHLNQMKLVLATALAVAGIFQLAVIQKVSGGGGGRGFGGLSFGGSRFGGGGWGRRGINNRRWYVATNVGSIRSKGVWYLTPPKTIFASKSSKKFAKAATFGAGAYVGSKISSKVRFVVFIILLMKNVA